MPEGVDVKGTGMEGRKEKGECAEKLKQGTRKKVGCFRLGCGEKVLRHTSENSYVVTTRPAKLKEEGEGVISTRSLVTIKSMRIFGHMVKLLNQGECDGKQGEDLFSVLFERQEQNLW